MGWRFRRRGLAKGWCGDEGGVAAVEFALLAPLFFFMIMVTLDQGLARLTEQRLYASTEEVGRLIRTGQFVGQNGEGFRNALCGKGVFLLSCSDLRFRVDVLDSFSELSSLPDLPPYDEGKDLSSYKESNASQIVLIRVQYSWDSFIPSLEFIDSRLTGKQIFTISYLFRNEPF